MPDQLIEHMSHLVKKLLCLALLSTAAAKAQTNLIQFQSIREQTALLELYTSEGCSSCPPAESWLSGLQDSLQLWKAFAPVAFHVDYWDSLGWKDAWSNAGYSERQRAYASWWRSDSVYTPGFILNGQEWRNWFAEKNLSVIRRERVGILTVTSADTNHWQASFLPEQPAKTGYIIHAALLAGGIVSDVKTGENQGHKLRHDFVAVNVVHIGTTTSNGVVSGKFISDTTRFATGKTLALTVWVTQAGQLKSLQATGGWLIPPALK